MPPALGGKKVDLKSQNRHQAREKLNVGEAAASAHWCPPVHQAALQLSAGATTVANKLLLPSLEPETLVF